MTRARPCPCGSGKMSSWQYDARGIELCRTCEDCHQVKMASYRSDVLRNPRYEADEQIEED
jgi:Zn-finger protein